MNEIDATIIADYLRLGPLDEGEVLHRAAVLVEDIKRIRFKTFRLSSAIYPYPDLILGSVVPKPLAEYHFGDTNFSVQKAVNALDDPATWFGGPGLDRGHLQFFSKASRIAHHVIPEFWIGSRALRENLRNPTQHLDTLEEVWWLARWKRLKRDGIRMAKKLSPELKGDVDWQIDLPGLEMTVNMEVKRLKSDVVRAARNLEFDAHRFTQFCRKDLLPKFRPSGDREVNVLALTLFGEIDPQVNDVLSAWLVDEGSLIDAIIVTSHHPLHGGLFYLHFANRKAESLMSELVPPDDEDRSMWFPIDLTYSIPGLTTPFRS
jgi:hypothetical protein